jgi:hypothetical protein
VHISARSIVLLAAVLPAARATTITILPANNIAQATAERNDWLTETFGPGTTAQPVQVDIDNMSPRESEALILQLLTSFHSLYFFITGAESSVRIRTADGSIAYTRARDDGIYFVGITSSTAIGSIQWRSQDEFRLVNFGIPKPPTAAPEPATWLLIATGVAAIIRRCRVPSAPS